MELVIFVGLQASGKSTFYRERFSGTHMLVSKDLMPNAAKRERRQRQLIAQALAAGSSVVVDNTNPTPDMRVPLVALGREFGALVAGYYFVADVRVCLARNRLREGRARVPDVALYATRKLLVPPTYAEGFDTLAVARTGPDGGVVVERIRADGDSAHEP